MEEKSNFKGLELLYKVHQQNLKSREDCLVAAVHMIMINKGNKCVGVGDSWTDDSGAHASELLPDDWNSNQEVYTMRYISSSSGLRYLLKVVKAGNSMLLNVVNVIDDNAAGMSVPIDNYISDNYGDFSGTFRDIDKLWKAFQVEIVQKIGSKASSSNKPSTSNESRQDRRAIDRRNEDERNLEDYATPDLMSNPNRVAFPSVGRGDLDPLGGFGGGMLFDPSNMFPRPTQPPFGGLGGLPRGSVPPGARFDPFGPPIGRGRGFQPNPDHLPPPDFEDDYIS